MPSRPVEGVRNRYCCKAMARTVAVGARARFARLHADPRLPRLPPARDRLERLQRAAGRPAGAGRGHGRPPPPGAPAAPGAGRRPHPGGGRAGGGATVALVCRERRPRGLPFVDAMGTWVDGEPRVEVLREPVRVTAWRPDIGTLLPTYVVDRYEGFDAKSFLDCTDEEVAAYVERNVGAIRDVVARARPDVA